MAACAKFWQRLLRTAMTQVQHRAAMVAVFHDANPQIAKNDLRLPGASAIFAQPPVHAVRWSAMASPTQQQKEERHEVWFHGNEFEHASASLVKRLAMPTYPAAQSRLGHALANVAGVRAVMFQQRKATVAMKLVEPPEVIRSPGETLLFMASPRGSGSNRRSSTSLDTRSTRFCFGGRGVHGLPVSVARE